MPTAVPMTVSAIGRVAQRELGASSAPTRLPTNIIRVIIEAARALLRVNTQTLRKPGVKNIFTAALFVVDVYYWGVQVVLRSPIVIAGICTQSLIYSQALSTISNYSLYRALSDGRMNPLIVIAAGLFVDCFVKSPPAHRSR